MSFQQGLSGLDAASQSLDVIGNNIANANSAGFKSSTAEFSDVFASSIGGGGGNSVGIGTQLAAVAQQFTQGDITTTNNPMDLAINGNGFFRMSDNGAISYTRDGEFQVNSSGFITNSNGQELTGYPADSTGTIVPAAPVPLQLSNSNLPPKATSSTDANLNLDATMSQPATGTFNPTDPTSYNSSTSISVYDSLGNAHTVSLYYVKTATTNQWNLQANVDGTAIGNVDLGGGAGNPEPIAFDNAGNLTTTMPINVSIDLNAVATANGLVNGANTPMTFTLDMTGSTQFGSGFAVNNLTQDGYTSGRLTSTSIGADGVIQGRYTNGQSLVLGQVVMANFNSPSGLKPLGEGQWAETTASGQPLVGVPGSGSNGAIQAGAIESSNVDLTAQLVEMITEQRAYQANAQSIKTQDAVLQTLVTLD
jgi:flagellar hook protein FlgE